MYAQVLSPLPAGPGSETQDPPSRTRSPTLGTPPRLRGAVLALAHLWLQTPPPVSCLPCGLVRQVGSQRPRGRGTSGIGDGDTRSSWHDPAHAPRGRKGLQTPRPRPGLRLPPPARCSRPPRPPRRSPGGKQLTGNFGPRDLAAESTAGMGGEVWNLRKGRPRPQFQPRPDKATPSRPSCEKEPQPCCLGTPSVLALTPRGADPPPPSAGTDGSSQFAPAWLCVGSAQPPRLAETGYIRTSGAPRSAPAERFCRRLAVRPADAKTEAETKHTALSCMNI